MMTVDTYIDPDSGKQWRKVLFERGDFPDNYTPDKCFLAAIKRNKNLHHYSFRQCVLGASQVALQVCMVILFSLVYISLDNGAISNHLVLLLSATAAILGYVSMRIRDFLIEAWRASLQSIKQDLKHVSLFLFFSFSFSPVLYKLTDTIATDTVHTTAGMMLFVHLLFHNYGLEKAAVVSNALSLNAAIFASICLASRLASSYDAFVILSVSVVAFVLFPLLRLRLEGTFSISIAVISIIGIVMLTFVAHSWTAAICACLSLLFVMVVSPTLFVRWQNHKHTIHGPWDEAVPNIPRESE